MGLDDTLIALYLHAHEHLKGLDSLKGSGKSMISEASDLLTQSQIMAAAISSQSLSPVSLRLYSLAKNNISCKLAHSATNFQTQFLSPFIKSVKALTRIEEKLAGINIGPIMDDNMEYWICLSNLKELAMQIAKQYQRQMALVQEQWKCIASDIFNTSNQKNLKSIKVLLLHISFQTEIGETVLNSWDLLITSLQSKRYLV